MVYIKELRPFPSSPYRQAQSYTEWSSQGITCSDSCPWRVLWSLARAVEAGSNRSRTALWIVYMTCKSLASCLIDIQTKKYHQRYHSCASQGACRCTLRLTDDCSSLALSRCQQQLSRRKKCEERVLKFAELIDLSMPPLFCGTSHDETHAGLTCSSQMLAGLR